MKKAAQIEIIAAAVLWGLIGLFARKLAEYGLTSMQCVAVRTGLSAVIYTAFLAVTRPSALKIHWKDIPYFLGTGICSLVFFNWCYFSAIEISGMAVSAVLLYTAPLFVMLMSALLFRERITAVKGAALAVTFLGCLLVTGALGGTERITTAALLYGLGAGFGYALYTIIGTFALRKYSSETVTAYTFLFGALAVVPLSRIWTCGAVLLQPGVIGSGLGISVVCCILPYVLYTKGLSQTAPGQAAILATMEPVTAALAGAVVFHEPMTFGKIAGIVLIVAAVVLLNLRPGRKKDHTEDMQKASE